MDTEASKARGKHGCLAGLTRPERKLIDGDGPAAGKRPCGAARNSRLNRSLLLALSGFLLCMVPAASAPGQGITDPNASLPPASVPLPPAGGSFTDPVFGTTVTRLTGTTSAGGWATQIYSQLQAFSSDNAYVLLIENFDYVVRRMSDGSAVSGLDTLSWNLPRWQPALTHTLLTFDTNADLDVTVRYTSVDTLVTTDVFTFPANYIRIRNNPSFDELSRDGRWVAGLVERDDGAGVIFSLDLMSSSLGAMIPVPDLYAGPCQRDPVWGEVEPDWIGVSPLGNYVVVQWARDGIDRCSGLETFDINTGAFVGRVADGHQHGDLGLLADGVTEVFVTTEFSSPADPLRPALAYHVLPGTATVAPPVYLLSIDWGHSDHISCQGPPGVCAVTSGGWPDSVWTPFEEEIYLVYMDGSVLRLTHHRSTSCGYWVQPRATMSADGSKVIFASDWESGTPGDSCPGASDFGAGEAYVVDVNVASCGDGTLDAGEECDDGNLVDGDGCDSNCRLTGCGNGIRTAGEECDDGNLVDGDCCSSTCTAEPAGSDCSDGSVCTGVEVCDGTGACLPGTSLDCDDGDPCTQDTCDPVSGCSSRDGPAATCAAAGRSVLKIADRADAARDRLTWKWSRGGEVTATQLGDPTAQTGYALCLWRTADGTSFTRVAALEVAGGGGWRSGRGGGFAYADRDGTQSGVVRMRVKAGRRATALVKAKGASLPLPGPDDPGAYFTAGTRLVAQLLNSTGTCWGADFTTPVRNTAERYVAKRR